MNRRIKNKNQLKQLVKESIDFYNRKRPHLSLKMKIPEEVYKEKNPDYLRQSGLIKICQLI